MAEQKKPSGSKELKQDAFVENLVPDPSRPPQDMIVLMGFLGESDQKGCWRLYLTPQLNEYVEIAEEDILYNQSLMTEQKPLGGTLLCVKRGAKMEHTRTVSQQVQAEFLQGDITAGFLPEMGRLELPSTYPQLRTATRRWECSPIGRPRPTSYWCTDPYVCSFL